MCWHLAWRDFFEHAARWLALAVLLVLCPAMPAHADNIESVLRPGELVQGHAKWEEECTKCHVRFDRAAQDKLCADVDKALGPHTRERTAYHVRQEPATCRGRGRSIHDPGSASLMRCRRFIPTPRWTNR